MSIEMNNKFGKVEITNHTIALIAGGAAVDCYGIVGMASRNQIKDGISEILRRENFSKGIVVRQVDKKLHIDMYVVASFGTKISVIAKNVQRKVKYVVGQMLGLDVDSVNIYVQSVRVSGS